VRLESSDNKLLDAHTGYSGGNNHNNVWFFAIPENAPTSGWRLIAEIRGGGGGDSTGIITVSLPADMPPGQQMPNGKTFSSPAELKQLLLVDYREEIFDNVIRRVLAYALGRKLEPIDRPAIEQIRASIDAEDYRITALIEAVVLSYPFTYKQSE
jgi:hypothetical protein